MTPEKQLFEERKQFLEDLKGLVPSELEEIFRIIKRVEIPYTENSNGIFFDINIIKEEDFQKLKQYIILCKSHRQDENKRVKEMEDLRAEALKPVT